MSSDVKARGAIRTIQLHTPNAHERLISSDDFLLTILTIRGMLKKGRIIPEINPIA
jgi:hypothetical protein